MPTWCPKTGHANCRLEGILIADVAGGVVIKRIENCDCFGRYHKDYRALSRRKSNIGVKLRNRFYSLHFQSFMRTKFNNGETLFEANIRKGSGFVDAKKAPLF